MPHLRPKGLVTRLVTEMLTRHAALLSGIPGNIPRVTRIFSVYTSLYIKKIKWQVGLSVVYHKRVHNYFKFIPCHRKYSGQHNRYDICAALDGKLDVGCLIYNGLLYSDWLYFLWHGINGIIFTRARPDDFKPIRIDPALDLGSISAALSWGGARALFPKTGW